MIEFFVQIEWDSVWFWCLIAFTTLFAAQLLFSGVVYNGRWYGLAALMQKPPRWVDPIVVDVQIEKVGDEP